MSRLALLLILILTPLSVGGEESVDFPAEHLEFFESRVRPLLVAHCYDCHSTDAKELKAGLYVDSREGLLKGGDSGPTIVAGKPDESELIAAVRYETFEMPPKQKLSATEIDTLVKWVEMGAPWPQVTATNVSLPTADEEIDWVAAREGHWAWQTYEKASLPKQREADANNAIDRFVDVRLLEKGLQRNEPAPANVLARRIYVDLIGIVPSPEQVDSFVAAAAHDRQSAVANLVDDLLQTPLYGQRWARHWLDVARYSDGRGGFLDNSALDQAWRYRDWVVNAINADLPINRFLELQIAGDCWATSTRRWRLGSLQWVRHIDQTVATPIAWRKRKARLSTIAWTRSLEACWA